MLSASKTAAPSGSVPDPQFNYVTMLLHGDGTNGAQNNTFLDSSTNAFSITRNGNTTQGSFSPYGSNWSNAFNLVSTPDYLDIASNAAFGMGTGDYTIESWFYCTDTGGYQPIIDCRASSPVTGQILFRVYATGQFYFSIEGTGTVLTSPANIATNTWVHAAVVKASGVYTLYINGTSVATASNSVSIPTSPVRIGNDQQNGNNFKGYLSNVRIVKGTAVYTSNFTPSTTPLTAVSGTSLLTCQSNRFVDNSSNAFAITANGTISVQRFNPFGTSTAYSTSVIGGSGYFDGSGDYLTVADNAALDVDAGSFTMEAWVYLTDATVTSPILAKNFGSAGGWMFWVQSTLRLRMYDASAGQVTATSSASLISNSWNHVAATRSSNTLTVYVNGVSSGTATFTGTSTNAAVLEIGGYGAATAVSTGYISDARLVKGSVVYTGNFTPPTAPLTAITNTSLLTNFTNGAIFDNAMMNDLETVGNAQISTSVKKYGTGSLSFDGTGDYLTTPNSPNLNFGSGDFTIELWLYSTVGTSNESVVNKGYNNAGNLSYLLFLDANTLGFFASSNGTSFDIASNISMGTATQNTWVHFAASRSGSSIRLFRNGTLINTVTSSATIYTGTTNLYIGSSDSGGLNFNGYIDDLRITKGYARYTATFTPPTAALPDTGPY